MHARFRSTWHGSTALHGVSWLGFYLHQGMDDLFSDLGGDKQLFADRSARACGRAFVSGQPLVVRDVAELGARDYIACILATDRKS